MLRLGAQARAMRPPRCSYGPANLGNEACFGGG